MQYCSTHWYETMTMKYMTHTQKKDQIKSAIWTHQAELQVELHVAVLQRVHCLGEWSEPDMWGKYVVALAMTLNNAHETGAHKAVSLLKSSPHGK
jgi:hypothetical protein